MIWPTERKSVQMPFNSAETVGFILWILKMFITNKIVV